MVLVTSFLPLFVNAFTLGTHTEGWHMSPYSLETNLFHLIAGICYLVLNLWSSLWKHNNIYFVGSMYLSASQKVISRAQNLF